MFVYVLMSDVGLDQIRRAVFVTRWDAAHEEEGLLLGRRRSVTHTLKHYLNFKEHRLTVLLLLTKKKPVVLVCILDESSETAESADLDNILKGAAGGTLLSALDHLLATHGFAQRQIRIQLQESEE